MIDCAVIAIALLACVKGQMPDLSKPVSVPAHCVARLSRVQRRAGPKCAAENGITYQVVGKRRLRRR